MVGSEDCSGETCYYGTFSSRTLTIFLNYENRSRNTAVFMSTVCYYWVASEIFALVQSKKLDDKV